VALNVLPQQGQSLILAGEILSIAINPLLFAAVEPAQRWLLARSALARTLARPRDPLAELPETVESSHVTGHVVVVGYGRTGKRVAASLSDYGVRVVVAEQDRALVERLRAGCQHAVAGNYDDD